MKGCGEGFGSSERKEWGTRSVSKRSKSLSTRRRSEEMSRGERETNLRGRDERQVDESSVRNEILFLSRQDGDLEGVVFSDEVGVAESKGVSSLSGLKTENRIVSSPFRSLSLSSPEFR